jgi:hypothetical protein
MVSEAGSPHGVWTLPGLGSKHGGNERGTATVTDKDVTLFVNGVTYGIIFSEELNDAEARRVAHDILTRPMFGMTPEEERERLIAAINSPTLTFKWESPYGPRSGEEIRAFLRKVLEQFDALRHPTA